MQKYEILYIKCVNKKKNSKFVPYFRAGPEGIAMPEPDWFTKNNQ